MHSKTGSLALTTSGPVWFLSFAHSKSGHLFFGLKGGEASRRAATVAGVVRKWLKEAHVIPEGVSPMHAFRHRFKSVMRELGVSDTVSDGITGHAGISEGSRYGSVSLKAISDAINRIPNFTL